MTIEVAVFHELPPDEVVQSAADSYIATFREPPYNEPDEAREGFLDRVQRYSARDGFVLAVASDGDETLGIALGVTAHPGDWWRDRVAQQLTDGEQRDWLGDACLEFVHLAVVPARQGSGIGGALHDAVVTNSTAAATGVLTVDRRVERAYRLYVSRGWIVLRESINVSAGPDMTLMARPLNQPR
jgi:GNAT superfamily N-acetyltransferase